MYILNLIVSPGGTLVVSNYKFPVTQVKEIIRHGFHCFLL